MNNENNFLITYGLHGFVNYTQVEEKFTFTISRLEGQKMIDHAKSLILGKYGQAADILLA